MKAPSIEHVYSGEFASLQDFEAWLHKLDSFAALLEGRQDAWAVLTRKPSVWLSREEMTTSLRVVPIRAHLAVAPYEQGVIFCSKFQLRWQVARSQENNLATEPGQVTVCYIGESLNNCAPLTERLTLNYEAFSLEVRERSYLLWGEQLANGLYGEGRIPIEIDYPLAAPARRVQVVVRSFVDAATGRPVAERWLRLEGIA